MLNKHLKLEAIKFISPEVTEKDRIIQELLKEIQILEHSLFEVIRVYMVSDDSWDIIDSTNKNMNRVVEQYRNKFAHVDASLTAKIYE